MRHLAAQRQGERAVDRTTARLQVGARATEHEVAGIALAVLRVDGEVEEGVVAAAAADHLLLEGRRGAVALPWTAVAALWPAAAPP